EKQSSNQNQSSPRPPADAPLLPNIAPGVALAITLVICIRLSLRYSLITRKRPPGSFTRFPGVHPGGVSVESDSRTPVLPPVCPEVRHRPRNDENAILLECAPNTPPRTNPRCSRRCACVRHR